MQCPNCGLLLDGAPESCPRCGQALAREPAEPQAQGVPASAPPGIYPPSYLSPYWPGQTVPPNALPGTPALPLQPAYPPSYPPYVLPYSFTYPAAAAGISSSRPHKRNTALLIVASLVCAVVLVLAGAVGGLTLAQSLGSKSAGSVPPMSLMPSATATATATPAANVLYHNTLRARALQAGPTTRVAFSRATAITSKGFISAQRRSATRPTSTSQSQLSSSAAPSTSHTESRSASMATPTATSST